MGIFSILASPLGIAMQWLYTFLQNYGFAIILFTILVRALTFPLGIKERKGTARTMAYQPMLQEIQKKWANDKRKQQQEVQKFYEENNIKMAGGCAPMLVNMLVLFGMIAVIQSPLNYILQVPADQVQNAVAIVKHYDPQSTIDTDNPVAQQSAIIEAIKQNPDRFIEGVPAKTEDGTAYTANVGVAEVEKVQEFNFQFLGLNLAGAPQMKFDAYLIWPILSVLTMLLSQVIIMKTNPSPQGGKSMIIMSVIMGAMFGFYAFTVPVGFSLYYTISNVMMLVQQMVLRKMYDPAKIREEIEAEMEARRAAKKAKKKVTVVDEAGEEKTLDVGEAELNRLRLERARALDAKRYAEDDADADKTAQAAEKARKLDEEKYGSTSREKNVDAQENSDKIPAESEDENAPENGAENAPENDEKPADKIAEKGEEKQPEYKPGRRMRARKKEEETSFAQQEQEREQQKISEEKEGE